MMAFLTWISGVVGYLAREKGKDWVKLLVFGFVLGLIDYIIAVISAGVNSVVSGLGILVGFIALALLLFIIAAMYNDKALSEGAMWILIIGFILFILAKIAPALGITLASIFTQASSLAQAMTDFSIIFVDLAWVIIGGVARELVTIVEKLSEQLA